MPRPRKPKHAPTPRSWHRVGRPPTRGVTATDRLEMRITPDERAAWTAAADGQPVGEWVRSVANRAARRKADG